MQAHAADMFIKGYERHAVGQGSAWASLNALMFGGWQKLAKAVCTRVAVLLVVRRWEGVIPVRTVGCASMVSGCTAWLLQRCQP